MRLPLRLIPKHRVVTVRAGLNRGMKWIVGSSIHGCWLGHYEHDKQEVVRRLVRPGMKVLDIGANAGFYTLAFSRLVGPQGRVWAFEPFAENAQNLLRHITLNGLTNVTLVQAAVSDRADLVGFHVAASNSMGALSSDRRDYVVPVVTLDDLLQRNVVPIPDIIKMDVEGAEGFVLQGASRILQSGQTSLLIALHGPEPQRTCLRELSRARYRVTGLLGGAIDPGVPCDEIVAIPGTVANA